jgi:hypothetical protein
MTLIFIALVLVGMTGFRSRMFAVTVLIFITSTYYSKKRAKTIFLWMLAGLAMFGFLMIAAPMLPRAIQRAVSFIPFIPVDLGVVERAAGSSDWRFELWRDYCIPNVPKYLLIGRGIAHDITSFAWLQYSWYHSSEFFYYMGKYHSGPFSLLLDYGLPGTISWVSFFLLVISDAWKTVRRYAVHQDSLAARYYVFLTILMTYEVFNFFVIFGDVDSGLFRFLATAAQLRILKKNFLMESLPVADVKAVKSVKPGQSASLKPQNPRARPLQRSDV